MRLIPEQLKFIKENLKNINLKADIYIFGSRADDNEIGGDIDILVISDMRMDKKDIRKFKIDFYKKFEWQKIDVVNFLINEEHPFKNLVLDKAIKL